MERSDVVTDSGGVQETFRCSTKEHGLVGYFADISLY